MPVAGCRWASWVWSGKPETTGTGSWQLYSTDTRVGRSEVPSVFPAGVHPKNNRAPAAPPSRWRRARAFTVPTLVKVGVRSCLARPESAAINKAIIGGISFYMRMSTHASTSFRVKPHIAFARCVCARCSSTFSKET